MNDAPAKISSPCRSVCLMDHRAKICMGCGRSLREVSMWSRLSEAERLAIMAELPERMAALPK